MSSSASVLTAPARHAAVGTPGPRCAATKQDRKSAVRCQACLGASRCQALNPGCVDHVPLVVGLAALLQELRAAAAMLGAVGSPVVRRAATRQPQAAKASRPSHWNSAWPPAQGSGRRGRSLCPSGPALRQAILAAPARLDSAGTSAGRRAATQVSFAKALAGNVRCDPAGLVMHCKGPGSCQGRPSSERSPSGLTPGFALPLPNGCGEPLKDADLL